LARTARTVATTAAAMIRIPTVFASIWLRVPDACFTQYRGMSPETRECRAHLSTRLARVGDCRTL
jgi:hypothetical protein